MKKDTKGQVQLTFNWLYILIAGGIILLFFVGIIVTQKQASDDRLSGDVVRLMESIYVAAGISEKTKNAIDTSGLSDFTLQFSCEDRVSLFGIKGKPIQSENSIDPIFAPREISTSRMILWSLPYNFPFKVIDFLFVTSENTKYYVVGESDFGKEFLNNTAASSKGRIAINTEKISDFSQITAGKNFHVRIVDMQGSSIQNGNKIPQGLLEMDDDAVSAVSFIGTNEIAFFVKEGNIWRRTSLNPIPIISLGGKLDAAKYAAIFAGDEGMYTCNMQKAFNRLEIVSKVYGGIEIQSRNAGGKLKRLLDVNKQPGLSKDCELILTQNKENVRDALTEMSVSAFKCKSAKGFECVDLISIAQRIENLNDDLRSRSCGTLY